MKKAFIIASAMLFTAGGAQAQFLNKLLDKATDKVISKATGKSAATATTSTSQADGKTIEPIFLNPYYGQESEARETFYYEGTVSPAAANNLQSLLSKLPAIPSGSEFLHPTKAIMSAYLRDIEAVSLRASQLEEQAEQDGEAASVQAQAARQAQVAQMEKEAMQYTQQMQDYAADAMALYNSIPDKDKQRIMELSPMLAKMSDAEAGAYLSAHPEDMAMMQKYGAALFQLNQKRPNQSANMMQLRQQMMQQAQGELLLNKAQDIIAAAPGLEQFVQRESSKVSATYGKQQMADAWSQYLTGMVAQVKAELLAINNNPDIPDYIKAGQNYRNIYDLCQYLSKAYDGNFNIAMPVNCAREVVRQLTLEPEEELVQPENFLGSLSALAIYKRNRETGNIFLFNGGKWTRMPDDFELDYMKVVAPAENRILTSADGSRQAVVSGTAGFIRLPEGAVVYPAAVEVIGTTIRWSELNQLAPQVPGGKVTWQIVECTYSL